MTGLNNPSGNDLGTQGKMKTSSYLDKIGSAIAQVSSGDTKAFNRVFRSLGGISSAAGKILSLFGV